MDSHQLINQTTGNQEWGTPSPIIEAARMVLGCIDLDPASCFEANKIVRAKRFFTKEDDGLKYEWRGNVWLNWPFGDRENICKPNCTKKTCIKRGILQGLNTPVHISQDIQGNVGWVNKLMVEWKEGHIAQAMTICFALTSEAWFKPLKAFPQCYLDGRTKYIDLTTGLQVKGVSKGSCVTYLGHNVIGFEHYFRSLGDVMWPSRYVDRSFFRGVTYESKVAA